MVGVLGERRLAGGTQGIRAGACGVSTCKLPGRRANTDMTTKTNLIRAS